jgi:hypothetical protein
VWLVAGVAIAAVVFLAAPNLFKGGRRLPARRSAAEPERAAGPGR